MFSSSSDEKQIIDTVIVDEVNLNNMIKKMADLDDEYLNLVDKLINTLYEAQEKKSIK